MATQDLYVVRHAEAIPRGSLEPDDNRWLTEGGRRRFYRAARGWARWLRGKKGKGHIEAVITSPLPRAVMTAELLARALRLSGPVEVNPLLRPEGDVEQLVTYLRGQTRRVAVVGHEPQLGKLLHALCGDAALREAEASGELSEGALPKGGIAALRLPDPQDADAKNGQARLRYVVTP